ncbi:MAG TPA: alpha-1,4-glucan--maltose-1-phosphate maltosyltransferase, partial [Demequina sp.]|nr:alpha-1,4-glucan--maltose-1-phosphate maltosyltransferase [Demequina sp.]
FVARSRELGMEVALDIALQCSPDHPWVTEHPEWFTTRADGTIAYAENPPKKYQDIYPLNFDNDPEGIYVAIRDMLEVWVSHGVTLFRVDNPHTKSLQFWQRLLTEFRAAHPDVVFLAEAFTRPAMMRTLGAVGYHQSYTYFAWRNTKQELAEYLQEVAAETSHLVRPAFWPTTHDILTPFMQQGGTAAFALRAVLAATGSPTYGIYSGYEFIENIARPGVEEQIDNEKYEFKPRDWNRANDAGIAFLLGELNRSRHQHPALQQLHQLTVHPTSNDSVLAYSKRIEARFSPTGEDDVVLVVVNLDPFLTHESLVYLDMEALGLDPSSPFRVHDELNGQDHQWNATAWVRLDPQASSAHVMSVGPL